METKPKTTAPAPAKNSEAEEGLLSPPSDSGLAHLAALLLGPGTLQNAGGNTEKDLLMQGAVDDALRLWVYAKTRRSELMRKLEDDYLCVQEFHKYATKETSNAYVQNNLKPRWEKTAMRFEPSQPTDAFREFLKRTLRVGYRGKGAKLMDALREWRKTMDGPKWWFRNGDKEQAARQCFDEWLAADTRRDESGSIYYLIGEKQGREFVAFRKLSEKARLAQYNQPKQLNEPKSKA